MTQQHTHTPAPHYTPHPSSPRRMWFGHHIPTLLLPPLWSQLTALRHDKKKKMDVEEEFGENKRREKVSERSSRRRQMWARDERRRGKSGEAGEVERMDCTHTPHTCQWLVVCGLRWMEGGRGVMKGGSVLNSARNCVKGRRASFEPSGERGRPWKLCEPRNCRMTPQRVLELDAETQTTGSSRV